MGTVCFCPHASALAAARCLGGKGASYRPARGRSSAALPMPLASSVESYSCGTMSLPLLSEGMATRAPPSHLRGRLVQMCARQ